MTSAPILSTREEAAALDERIMRSGENLAVAYVEFAVNLKEMRDKKLYTQLGYETFEQYTTERVGLRQSQAYTWIQSLERLGIDEFRSTAKYGITKLHELAKLMPAEREEFIESHDVGEMSTRELKEEIARLKEKCEQLTLFGEEKASESAEDADRIKALQDEKTKLEQKLSEALTEIESKKETKPDEKLIEEQRLKAKEEARAYFATQKEKEIKKLEEQHKKELEKVKEQSKKETEDTVKKAVEKAKKEAEVTNKILTEENRKALERAHELEAKLKVTSSPETTEFSLYFKTLQETLVKLKDVIERIADNELKAKLSGNMIKFADILRSSFE